MSIVAGVQLTTQILRVPLLAYFLLLTVRYLRGTEATDGYTALTFIFLSAQLFFQLGGGTIDYLMLTSWGSEYGSALDTTVRCTRAGVFFSQNTALFINLGRWFIILKSLQGFAHFTFRARVKRCVGIAVAANLAFTAFFLVLVALQQKTVANYN